MLAQCAQDYFSAMCAQVNSCLRQIESLLWVRPPLPYHLKKYGGYLKAVLIF
jgi:hypothetical protein